MKKILLLSILCFSLQGFSQEIQPTENTILSKKNEFRINVTKAFISKRIEFSYERFLNKRFSTGLSVLFLQGIYEDLPLFGSNDLNKTNNYQIIPYARYRINKNPSKYWYFELFSSLNSGNNKVIERLFDGNYIYYDYVQKRYTNIALGTSIGFKFYIKKKFVVDSHFGLAPNLINNSNSPDVITRLGINVGYRF